VKVSSWIRQKSTSIVSVSTLIIFLVYTSTVLPDQSEKAKTQSGETSPDTLFFYSVEELYNIAESYGEVGRAYYVRTRFTFDLVWPIVYTSFLASCTSWIFSRSFDSSSTIQQVNLIPLIGMMLDYLENISASIVMLRYPIRTPILDISTVILTPLKWVFVGGSFVVLLVGVLRYGVKTLMNMVNSQ